MREVQSEEIREKKTDLEIIAETARAWGMTATEMGEKIELQAKMGKKEMVIDASSDGKFNISKANRFSTHISVLPQEGFSDEVYRILKASGVVGANICRVKKLGMEKYQAGVVVMPAVFFGNFLRRLWGAPEVADKMALVLSGDGNYSVVPSEIVKGDIGDADNYSYGGIHIYTVRPK